MKAKAKVIENTDARVVLPLLALALATNFFLFAVSYSNASFQGEEQAFPNILAPSQISRSFDQALNQVADNLVWGTNAAVAAIKPAAAEFLGLNGYKFGATRHTALMPHPQTREQTSSAVLGATIVNPAYFVGE